MKKQIQLVENFHKKFRGPIGNNPQLIDPKRSDLRHMLMNEEVQEYLAGVKKGDLQNITKELCDILYTVYGTIIEHGLQDVIEAAFAEVHRSNMSKNCGTGKAIKGKNYTEADMSKFIS